ncbi:MAG: hypothetical protein V2A56_02735 [bacterium]
MSDPAPATRREETSPLLRVSSRLGIPPYAFAALLIGVILRVVVVFSAAVRMDQTAFLPAYNDEYAHLNHVRYSATVGGTPPQYASVHESDAFIRGDFEYWQPPLYYTLTAPLWRLHPTDLQTPVLLRFFSLILWTLALITVLRALPDAETRGPLILADTLLGIGLVHSATVNNDALFAVAASALYLFAARALLRPLGWKEWTALALLASAAAYTKLSSLPLMPMVAVTAWVGVEGSRRRKTASAAGMALAVLLLTLPLWIIRYKTYGAFLGTVSVNTGGPYLSIRELTAATLLSLQSPWSEFWHFKVVKIPALLFPVVSLFSLAWIFLRWQRVVTTAHNLGIDKILAIWSVGAVGTLGGFLYYGLRFDQTDPRFLIGAGPVLALVFGAPLWVLPTRKAWAIGWGIFLLILLPHLSWLGV